MVNHGYLMNLGKMLTAEPVHKSLEGVFPVAATSLLGIHGHTLTTALSGLRSKIWSKKGLFMSRMLIVFWINLLHRSNDIADLGHVWHVLVSCWD